MKQAIFIILISGILFLVCSGCTSATLVNTECQQVNAIVTDVSFNSRWDYHYVYVAYEGCQARWYDESKALYSHFENRLGNTIPCYLITYTYDNGIIEQELVFNEDLWEGK